MNIKQIKYYVAVVEQGSLSAAAKSQYVTVQAVSKAIADLERELGNDLLVRESRGVRPTSFGRAFHHKAELALQSFTELESFADSYQTNCNQSTSLRLALCAPRFDDCQRACASIASFVTKCTGVETAVTLGYGIAAIEALREGLVDAVVIVGKLFDDDVDCTAIGTVSPGILMAKDHPLATKSTVSLADLEDYPVGTSPAMDTFNESIVNLYRKQDRGLRFVEVAADDLDRFYQEDRGVNMVANVPALGSLHAGSVIRPVAKQDALPVPICIVCMKDRKGPAYRAVERLLVDKVGLMLGFAGFAKKFMK